MSGHGIITDTAHLQHTQQLLDISSLRLQQLVHHVTEMYTHTHNTKYNADYKEQAA